MSEAEKSSESPQNRRRVLNWLAKGFLSLWALGFVWVIGAFLKPPHSRRSLSEGFIKVGPLDSLAVGGARLVRHGREPIFVVRTAEDTFIGLSAICTHLHCILDWDGERGALACPCHEGAFDVNGNVVQGPPPRPLKRFRVETRLGEIYVHL